MGVGVLVGLAVSLITGMWQVLVRIPELAVEHAKQRASEAATAYVAKRSDDYERLLKGHIDTVTQAVAQLQLRIGNEEAMARRLSEDLEKLQERVSTSIGEAEDGLERIAAQVEAAEKLAPILSGEQGVAFIKRIQTVSEYLRKDEGAQAVQELASRLEQLQSVLHEGTFDSLRCSSLDVLDPSGAALVTLGKTDHGGEISVRGKSGSTAALMSADQHGNGNISVFNKLGNPTVRITGYMGGPGAVWVLDAQEHIICSMAGDPFGDGVAFVCDRNGKQKAIISANVDGKGCLVLVDDKGRAKRYLP